MVVACPWIRFIVTHAKRVGFLSISLRVGFSELKRIEKPWTPPYKHLKIKNSWLLVLAIIVVLLSLLFAKKIVEAQATSPVQSVSPTNVFTSEKLSDKLKLKTTDVLERIALCESQNNPKAKNPTSSASGRFQFLKSSWEFYGKELWGSDWVNRDIFSYEDNTLLAIYVYGRNGTSDWLASATCWNVPHLR